MGRIELQTHGARKYPRSVLLKSSAGLGWSTISAELRAHGVGETPVVVPQQVEFILVVGGNQDGWVRRSGAGQRQESVATTGTIQISPIQVGDNTVDISAPIPEALHLYLPTALFRQLSDDFNLPGMPAHSIRYAAGIRDEMMDHIGRSILSEMNAETGAAGRMFVETASLMLAARLIRSYCDSGSVTPVAPGSDRFDHVRLRRVLDYIWVHLANEFTLADLARIAGLSVFHFARMFTRAIGVPPHRYVNRLRLERAMGSLAAGRLPLAQISFDAGFSSQASFTRAFRRATGMTPGEFRQRRR